MKREKILRLESVSEEYKRAKLERFKRGYPLKFKRTKPREKFKSKALLNFFLRTTPPARDILSGRAFSELFKRSSL